MMSFKRHLMAMGSAIALMTGAAPAFAYSNKAYINQPGSYNSEPPRVCRRLFVLSHATIASSSICA